MPNPLTRNNVTVTGNPEARKTMVFVNGLGTDQSYWNLVTPPFAHDYRLVLFDNVGSIETNQDYFRGNQFRYLNVNGYAADLLEICSALDLDGDTILVGHSLGAMAGLLASIQRPRQFKHLILIGASPRYANTENYQGGFSTADIAATYSTLERNYEQWTQGLAVAVTGNPDELTLAKRFADSIGRIPQKMMLTILCSVLQTDHRSDLGKVSVPTLLIQSREDYFVPIAVAEYIQANIPDCQLTMINAKGHLPHVSAPNEVIAAINHFIG